MEIDVEQEQIDKQVKENFGKYLAVYIENDYAKDILISMGYGMRAKLLGKNI